MMTVNGLELPVSFVRFFEEQRYSGWLLKENVDAYGNPLNTDFMPLGSVERMEGGTAGLAQSFGGSPEEVLRWTEKERNSPGFIPYIDDLSKIAQFGRTAGGAPFCFDFREGGPEPSVIHWDDGGSYWRRLAPNFETFISLFERYEEEEYEGE